MKAILITLLLAAVCVACVAQINQDAEGYRSYHARAKEALAVAQGVYITSRDVYRELRASGEIDDELHEKIIVADERLRAAYLVAQEAVAAGDEPTIKSALQTVCAMAETLTSEISSITDANKDTIRNVRIALIVLRRIALLA